MCEPVRHRVLVTGASGSALVHALASSHTVYAFSHSRCIEGKYPASVTCKQIDLTDESALKSAIATINPHVILHAAAICRSESIEKDKARAEAVNVKASGIIAAAAAELSSTWLIFFSSADVFSTSDGVCKPNSPAHPTSLFGEMKLRAEEAVRAKFTAVGILRLSKVYGITSRPTDCRVTHVVHRLAQTKGADVMFDNETVYSPVWASDVAYICQQLLERKQKHCGFSGTWHWSGQERLTDYAIAQQAAPLLGVPVERVKPHVAQPQLKPLHPDLDVTMLKVMGVSKHTPFAEALQLIVNEVMKH